MTDVAIKASLCRPVGSSLGDSKGHFVTGAVRQQVSLHNRNTHFNMGKHYTVHYSTAALATAHRKGISEAVRGNSA